MNEDNYFQAFVGGVAAAGWLALSFGAATAVLAGNQPVITGFSPAFGRPGDAVVINGQNLGGAASVVFNGRPAASFSSTAPTQVQATVPADATTGPVGVRTAAGSAFSVDSFVAVGAGPYITDFSPTLGAPGDTVVINGVNFTGVTAVKFNGTNASFLPPVGDTQISARVPANANTGPLTIVTAAGTNTTGSNFVATGYGPYITDFSPNNGRPGDLVWINGLNLGNATTVRFNGTQAGFHATAATQLQASVPTAATTGPITVATPLGTNTSPSVFVVGNAPLLTGFAPTNGPPGATVVINGANFLGTTMVLFNGTNAVFFVTAPTQITAQVPDGATTGPITVVTPNGTNTSAAAFAVLRPPVITGFTPGNGPPTTSVIIAGTNFLGATDVLFNGTGAIFTVESMTNIATTVPPTATPGPIIVVTPAGTAFSSDVFVVTAPTAPTITGFSPAGGPVGTVVAILGTQFVTVLAVKFNGVIASATTVSSTEIDATVPAGASTGPITVTTKAGAGSSTNSFVVGPAPVIGSFSPTNGPAGTIVQVTGANFLGATTVEFNGIPARFVVSTSSQLTTQVPSTAHTGPIAITTPTGTAVSRTDFVVARLANLSLRQTVSATQSNVGGVLTNSFSVVNNGPSDATGATFTDVLPNGLDLVSASSTLGTVSRTTNRVTGNLGALPLGAGATITLVVVPTGVGTITNTGTVAAAEADPSPADNAAPAVVTVLGPVLRIRPLPARSVEIGWSGLAAGFNLQVAGQPGPAGWVTSTDPPGLVGGRYLVTNAVSGNAGFYRLRRAP